MAVNILGPRIVFGAASDSITLNCPIKKIIMLAGSATNLVIDNTYFYFSIGRELKFPNLKGYPGAVLRVPDTLQNEVVFLIEEIGDVLNPHYFKEDIQNWNGQGAAVATAAETEATPAVAKATRSKKAEVTE